MASPAFWKTPALYELPLLTLEESVSSHKIMEYQTHMVKLSQQEFNSYMAHVSDLQIQMQDPSLPYDAVALPQSQLYHYQLLAALSYRSIESYHQQRYEMLKKLATRLRGHWASLHPADLHRLSGPEQEHLHTLCKERIEIEKSRQPLPSTLSSNQQKVMFIKSVLTSDLTWDATMESEHTNRPLRWYPKGLTTSIHRDHAEREQRMGNVLYLPLDA